MAEYYNSWKCFISGDIGIDDSEAHRKQYYSNWADKKVVISHIQLQIIFWDIPVLIGKLNSHANSIHTPHMTTNNQPTSDLLTFCVNQSGNCFYLSVTTYVEMQILLHKKDTL